MNANRLAGDVGVAAARGEARVRRVSAYLALTKARLALLVVFTTLAGYVLGTEGSIAWSRLAWTLVGTGLTAVAANIFNQWMEVRADGRMLRTSNRPLPAGTIPPQHAFALASGMMSLGLALLLLAVNPLSALLAAVAAAVYLVAYTPLKTRTSLCTLVGAICGAIPPMIGWTAATGRLSGGAWVLGGTLLVWQIPHFLALGWVYRKDYARAGFRILPVLDRSGDLTALLAILYCLALVPTSIAASLVGLAGAGYAAVAFFLGAGMIGLAVQFHHRRTAVRARRLFLASVAYLPLLFGAMLMDRGPLGILHF